MKEIVIHFVLFLLYQQCYATIDSLPACIEARKLSTQSLVTEYEYKGQRWFVFTEMIGPNENNTSDKIYRTKFYDVSCKLVCTRFTGGITGMDKTTPDTVEKAKIKKLPIVSTGTIHQTNIKELPDSIVKLAGLKKSRWIEQKSFIEGNLYRFQSPEDKESSSRITFTGSYYNSNGQVSVAPYNRVGRQSWWHFYNGKYFPTRFLPGYRQIKSTLK